jgi:hypothetical protein
MSSDTTKLQQVLDSVDALREEVGRLGERVAALEVYASGAAQAADAPSLAEQEELVATISAAIAAYLGVKPHIRQIRLLNTGSWAQTGRASVQASHILNFHDR